MLIIVAGIGTIIRYQVNMSFCLWIYFKNVFEVLMEEIQLSQAKKRTDKIPITDVAITKVPYIEYKGLDDKQNKVLWMLAKTVLQEAMEYNDSNEVAITFDLNSDLDHMQYSVTYGTEDNVDICADNLAYHILQSAKQATIVILHNHPTAKTFSPDDISFFLMYKFLKYIVVVTNQGTLHYMMKDKKYDFEKAVQLYTECLEELDANSSVAEVYAASLSFIARCSEVGLFYT